MISILAIDADGTGSSQTVCQMPVTRCSLYLLGGKPEVAEKAANRLMESHPNLSIVGTHHGYFKKSTNSDANNEVIDKINLADPDIVLVGFGMPLQEQWLIANKDRINAILYIPVGALFDYLAGEMPRPPKLLTDRGFEWLGRLMTEPTRLWQRYIFGLPIFYIRILRSRSQHTAK